MGGAQRLFELFQFGIKVRRFDLGALLLGAPVAAGRAGAAVAGGGLVDLAQMSSRSPASVFAAVTMAQPVAKHQPIL